MDGGTISDGVTNDTAPDYASGITHWRGSLSVKNVTFRDLQRGALAASEFGGSLTFSHNTITRAGTAGYTPVQVGPNITLDDLTDNVITDSGAGGYPAIGVDNGGDPAILAGNRGTGNSIDAIVMAWGASKDFPYVPVTQDPAIHPLGYVFDGLGMGPGTTLIVPRNAVVKVMPGKGIGLSNARLDATAGGAVFTSVADNSVGVAICPSILVTDCHDSADEWTGVSLYDHSTVDMVGGRVRDAIVDFADSTVFSTSVLYDFPPPGEVHLTDTTLEHSGSGVDGTHLVMTGGRVADIEDVSQSVGIPAYLTYGKGYGVRGDAMHVDGATFTDNAGPAVFGTNEWVTNSAITRVGTAGDTAVVLEGNDIRLWNNTITDSGLGGDGASAATILGFTGDLASAVHGNQLARNAMDGIDLSSVTQTATMTWAGPGNAASLHPAGYFGTVKLVPGATLIVPNRGLVRGSVVLNGGRLDA
ncbi:MAG: hypothetical protein JOZ37_11275, partial [Actinobacteria bacterium]|nr:hypothetical protein [Actinomycetota bacterium]